MFTSVISNRNPTNTIAFKGPEVGPIFMQCSHIIHVNLYRLKSRWELKAFLIIPTWLLS
jgi:hypothetical protein